MKNGKYNIPHIIKNYMTKLRLITAEINKCANYLLYNFFQFHLQKNKFNFLLYTKENG